MSMTTLLSPILNGGIQNINFVNGRVLTAEDMTAERKASLQRQRLMGTCVGDGVAYGLEVTKSSSSVAYGQQVVHVTAGVAVNRNGDTLQLTADTDVTLAATLPTAPTNGGLFTPCQPPQTQLTNPGIYVLTIMPASGYQEQVAVAQLNSAGVATSCSSRFTTAGVQFRLSLVTLTSTGTGLQPTLYGLANQIQTQLNLGASAASVAPALSQFRNGLAYACFGTEELAGFVADPFAGLEQGSSLESYGLMDDQRSAGLMTDCEVPLAIIYWSLQGIQFLDMWSVRRPVFPAAASEEWPVFSGRRRTAEGLSMFLQFQEHMNDLPSTLGIATPGSVEAAAYFLYLPPTGILLTSSSSPAGFSYVNYFLNLSYRNPVFVNGSRIQTIICQSLLYEPIDLGSGELIRLYLVRENQQAIAASGASGPEPYLIFVNGHSPYYGDAHYQVARWDYSNYS